MWEARKKGVVKLKDLLEKDADLFDKIGLHWLNQGTAYKRNKMLNMTMKDLSVKKWNGKGAGNPARFYKNIECMGKDSCGDCIYKYNYNKGK